jgi:hypothetical protein
MLSLLFSAGLATAAFAKFSPENIEQGSCNACATAAAPGLRLTYDPNCINDGGLGCVATTLPDVTPALYNGCRFWYTTHKPFQH